MMLTSAAFIKHTTDQSNRVDTLTYAWSAWCTTALITGSELVHHETNVASWQQANINGLEMAHYRTLYIGYYEGYTRNKAQTKSYPFIVCVAQGCYLSKSAK